MAEEMKTTPNAEQVNETENTPTPEAEATASETPAEEANDLVARIEQLEAELAQVQDKFLRTAAELQNYRRRVEQEKRQLLEMGKTLAIRPLLEVLDDLERSLEAARQAETQDPGAATTSCVRASNWCIRNFSPSWPAWVWSPLRRWVSPSIRPCTKP